MKNHYQSKVKAITGQTIYDIEKSINDFSQSHRVFATQIFQLVNGEGYDCLVHYEEVPMEDIMDKPSNKPTEATQSQKKEEMATDKQKWRLKQMGYKKKELEKVTKKEAFQIIKESQGGKK